jgi:hypothetical protein
MPIPDNMAKEATLDYRYIIGLPTRYGMIPVGWEVAFDLLMT